MNDKLYPVFSEKCQHTIVYFCMALRCPVNVLNAVAFASLPPPEIGLKWKHSGEWFDQLEARLREKEQTASRKTLQVQHRRGYTDTFIYLDYRHILHLVHTNDNTLWIAFHDLDIIPPFQPAPLSHVVTWNYRENGLEELIK